MSVEEQVVKIIDAKADKIKKETMSRINETALNATSAFEAELKNLREQSRIVLPVNILDIISRGGDVTSKIVKLGQDERNIIGVSFHGWTQHVGPMELLMDKGTYRVVLIAEKLEEE